MTPPYFAYVGPGAGFAFLGSFLTLLLSVLASITSLLLWPFRLLRLALRRHRGRRPARVKKLIFLGWMVSTQNSRKSGWPRGSCRTWRD